MTSKQNKHHHNDIIAGLIIAGTVESTLVIPVPHMITTNQLNYAFVSQRLTPHKSGKHLNMIYQPLS